jgi:hypothetical protein
MCSLLQLRYGCDDLLEAYWSGTIPKSGELCCGRSKYRFHGSGCYFENESCRIDIDFGPGGRYDGFDAYRLHRFSLENGDSNVLPLDKIQTEIVELLSEGLLQSFPSFSRTLVFPTVMAANLSALPTGQQHTLFTAETLH